MIIDMYKLLLYFMSQMNTIAVCSCMVKCSAVVHIYLAKILVGGRSLMLAVEGRSLMLVFGSHSVMLVFGGRSLVGDWSVMLVFGGCSLMLVVGDCFVLLMVGSRLAKHVGGHLDGHLLILVVGGERAKLVIDSHLLM